VGPESEGAGQNWWNLSASVCVILSVSVCVFLCVRVLSRGCQVPPWPSSASLSPTTHFCVVCVRVPVCANLGLAGPEHGHRASLCSQQHILTPGTRCWRIAWGWSPCARTPATLTTLAPEWPGQRRTTPSSLASSTHHLHARGGAVQGAKGAWEGVQGAKGVQAPLPLCPGFLQ